MLRGHGNWGTICGRCSERGRRESHVTCPKWKVKPSVSRWSEMTVSGGANDAPCTRANQILTGLLQVKRVTWRLDVVWVGSKSVRLGRADRILAALCLSKRYPRMSSNVLILNISWNEVFGNSSFFFNRKFYGIVILWWFSCFSLYLLSFSLFLWLAFLNYLQESIV